MKNDKTVLQWAIAENETGERFEVEKSNNGKNFVMAGLLFTTEKQGIETYFFKDAATAGNT